jgi:hypothetical protein
MVTCLVVHTDDQHREYDSAKCFDTPQINAADACKCSLWYVVDHKATHYSIHNPPAYDLQ